jgi:hypothetical protein
VHLFICLAYQNEACSDAQLWDCSEQRHRGTIENRLHEENVTDGERGILKL